MGLEYTDLDGVTRSAMVVEVERDIASGSLYVSPRLNERGIEQWPGLLLEAARSGSDDSLARELMSRGLLKTHEMSHRNGKPYQKAVPVTAPITLAEGEFNRMYLRGLAVRGIADGRSITIYRGRPSANPRTASRALEGKTLPAGDLLADLRSKDVDGALGLPPGPNSGMTGRLSR